MKTPLEPLVIVILPDPEQCEAVCRAVRQREITVRAYAGFGDCLEQFRRNSDVQPCCVVCPLAIEGSSGLQFQYELGQLTQAASIVFFDLPSSMSEVVEAMRQRAVAVVEPREDLCILMGFIDEGVERSCRRLEEQQRGRDTLERLGSLKIGEHQVLQGIMAGKRNREIAVDLKLSIRTIEQRRRDVFIKMEAKHAAVLARKVMEAAQTPLPHSDVDDRVRWLESVRQELALPLARRSASLAAPGA